MTRERRLDPDTARRILAARGQRVTVYWPKDLTPDGVTSEVLEATLAEGPHARRRDQRGPRGDARHVRRTTGPATRGRTRR